IIERTVEDVVESRFGGRFRMVLYVNKAAYAEHVALVKGDIDSPGPVLVRMHAASIMDIIGDREAHGRDLQESMKMIAEAGRGVVVVLREPRATSLSDRIKRDRGGETVENTGLRDIGVGAQILIDLGVREMILLSNTQRNIVGLEGFGLSVLEQRSIPIPPE
ncbi:MAG: 3,4-dihydroxy-2-butanone-4-phosphate synthase, partial [Alphaproteobacteria bacterium]